MTDGHMKIGSNNGDEGSQDSYQDTIKRPAVDAEIYLKAEKACVGEDIQPNRLIQETFNSLFDSDGEPIDGYGRLNKFAEQNDLTIEEAMNLLLVRLLDSAGNIDPNFRKQMFFDSEYW